MPENTFFIADTHFGDEAIIRYENRPFKNMKKQEEILIKNWNEIVQPDDTVYILGDFGMSSSKEDVARICGKLNGKKILIMGNHDTNPPEWYRKCGFAEASPWPIIYRGFWILSHKPMYINENMPYANIFGHVHANSLYKDCSIQSFCACVERTGYRPVSFDEIHKKIIKEINMRASGTNS